MVDKTLNDLITRTERELGQVAGISVQVYAKDLLAQKLEAAFDFHFAHKTIKWKRFLTYQTYTLDGSTGRVTGNVTTTFREFGDIYSIFPEGSDRKITALNLMQNPARYTGDSPLHYMADATATKLFKVLPITATGDIVVVGRQYPSITFANTDIIPFDAWCLIYHAAWQYAVDDGANPGQINKLQNLYQAAFDNAYAADQQAPVQIDRAQPYIPNDWFEV